MMNQDEKFQQRWEFRRRGDEGDSSTDDSKSNSSGEPLEKKRKIVNDLLFPSDDEVSDTPRCHQNDKLGTNNGVHFHSVEAAKKKVKPRKKNKNVVPKISKRSLVVKENRKRKRNLNAKEMMMLEDVKTFADSLIHELKVAQEDMFAVMKEEMRKLLASRPIKKKIRCSQKNKGHPQSRIELDVKTQNWSRGSAERSMKSNVTSGASNVSKAVEAAVKHDQVLELFTTNELRSMNSNVASDATNFSKTVEATTENERQKSEHLRLVKKTHVILAPDSDRVVPSPVLTIPAVVPKPHVQGHRAITSLNDHIPAGVQRKNLGTEIEIGKLTDAKNCHHGFPASRQEQFGSSPRISCKTVGFLGQNCPQTARSSVGFSVSLNQGLGYNSSMSSQTYSENSFRDKSSISPRRNSCSLKVPGGNPALPDYVWANSIGSNLHHKVDGEFVSLRLQELKDDQIYRGSLRNKQ